MSSKYQKLVEDILSLAEVKINGSNPWDIQIFNSNFYKRVLTEGELGLGESYMDEWWDSPNLDQFIYKILSSNLQLYIRRKFLILLGLTKARLFNPQIKSKAFVIGKRHYDLGNELFRNMLDKRMNYSCAYWKNVNTLDEAQENKLELICKKINLQPGIRVLDIGCGWGAFCKYAAEKYNVESVGITVSKEQLELAKKICEGLPVEIKFMDYRDVNGQFDRIVSVGMIEHVGYKNYHTYFKKAYQCLKDKGLFLVHTIGGNWSVKGGDPWTEKYIFPNSMLPSISQIANAVEGLFVIEDVHNFGSDYDKTLMAWYNNFKSNWDKLKKFYDERFYRMWKYFLLSSAGAFRARYNQLWQIVLSKNGVEGGYQPVR